MQTKETERILDPAERVEQTVQRMAGEIGCSYSEVRYCDPPYIAVLAA